MWQLTCFLALASIAFASIKDEIKNTKQLIKLYQEKVKLLQQYQILNNDSPSNSSTKIHNVFPNANTIILRKGSFSQQAYFLPPQFIVSGNQIYSLNFELLFNFLGKTLTVQNNQLTTLIKNQVNIIKLVKNQQKFQKSAHLLTLHAKDLRTKWHQCQQFQNILVQINETKLHLITQKQTKVIQLHYQILNIYSLNQYKLFFITHKSYGVINVRSGSVLQAFNLTQKAISVDVHDTSIIVLLQNCTILRFLNEKILASQNLLSEHSDINKNHSLQIQYIFPFLFLTSNESAKINIFNISGNLKWNFWKSMQLVLPQQLNSQINHFSMNFYKQDLAIGVLVTFNKSKTYHYDLQLSTKIETSEWSFPWRLFVFIVGLACFAFFKMRSSSNSQEQNNNKNYSDKLPQDILKNTSLAQIQKLLEKGSTKKKSKQN